MELGLVLVDFHGPISRIVRVTYWKYGHNSTYFNPEKQDNKHDM